VSVVGRIVTQISSQLNMLLRALLMKSFLVVSLLQATGKYFTC